MTLYSQSPMEFPWSPVAEVCGAINPWQSLPVPDPLRGQIHVIKFTEYVFKNSCGPSII